jgi:EAL domain-containing protein (putative c-di-GMP-specific phosphodiesterase class I)
MGVIGFAMQPVINTQNNKLEFFEILARIPHDRDQTIEACDFIKKIEELALMRELERTILYKAMVYLSEHPEIKKISINISLDYLDEDFERDFNQFLQEVKMNPQRILIEITEKTGLSLDKHPRLLEKLFLLKKKGFLIVLDDFGQKNSNINLLKEFPWDIVKIDGEFIAHIINNQFDQELIKFLVKLSRIQGFKLVAEFVEDDQIVQFLKEAGVHFLQGFFVGQGNVFPSLDGRHGRDETHCSYHGGNHQLGLRMSGHCQGPFLARQEFCLPGKAVSYLLGQEIVLTGDKRRSKLFCLL